MKLKKKKMTKLQTLTAISKYNGFRVTADDGTTLKQLLTEEAHDEILRRK
jgi:hypothetical protein